MGRKEGRCELSPLSGLLSVNHGALIVPVVVYSLLLDLGSRSLYSWVFSVELELRTEGSDLAMKLTSSSFFFPPSLSSSYRQLALLSLYFFRSAAIAVYVLCGLFTDNYVLSVSAPPPITVTRPFFLLLHLPRLHDADFVSSFVLFLSLS